MFSTKVMTSALRSTLPLLFSILLVINAPAAKVGATGRMYAFEATSTVPVITLPGTDPVSVDENAYVTLDPSAAVTDPDSTVFGLLTVTVSNAVTGDQLQVLDQGAGTDTIDINTAPNPDQVFYCTTAASCVQIGTMTGQNTKTIKVTFNASATLSHIQAILRIIRFSPTSNSTTSVTRNVTFTLTAYTADAVPVLETSAPVVKHVNVTPLNDPISISGFSATVTYVEDGAPKQLDSALSIADADNSNLDTGYLKVWISTAGTADDRLEISSTLIAKIKTSGSDVLYNGIKIGTFAGGSGTTPLIITFNTNSSDTAATALLKAITFSNVSHTPSATQRQVSAEASDGDGSTGLSPTTVKVNITLTNDAPDTTIDSHPADPSADTTPLFTFSGSDWEGNTFTFECAVDAGAYSACTSPFEITPDLSNPASHTFYVRAVESTSLLQDPTPASYTWLVDLGRPETTIDSKPANPDNDSTPTFTFHGTDNNGIKKYMCQIDSDPETECSSPYTLGSLSDGSHTFSVYAIDNTDLADLTPDTWTWMIDTNLPNSIILTNPPDPDNDSSPTFTFTAEHTAVVEVSYYECQMDSEAWVTPCSSPYTYGGALSAGSHTFYVRIVDSNSDTESTPASYPWVVDLGDPNTAIGTKPPLLSNDATPAFTFSGSDPGGTGVVGYQCQLTPPGGYASCSTPLDLTLGADGSYTFDVYAVDAAGNVDPSPATYSWTLDTIEPVTSLDGHPNDPDNDPTPTFNFSATDLNGIQGYQCLLDGSAVACGGGSYTTPSLSDDIHNFEVWAIDNAGNADSSPEIFIWTVDTTAPTTNIDETPANPDSDPTPTFYFSGDDGAGTGVASFECAIDDILSYAACTSGAEWGSSLSDGIHTFYVRAVDLAGNKDASTQAYTWKVDTSGPSASITENPPDPDSDTTPTFSFTGNDGTGSGLAGFLCQMDSGGYSSCTSPHTGSVSDGSHTFYVKAVDVLDNAGAPASYTWLVDATAPDTMITTTPPDPDTDNTPTFEFTGDDGSGTGVAGFECKVDPGGTFAACSTPYTLPVLADGSHTFYVRAVDMSGNHDGSPDEYTWVVDTTGPVTTINDKPAEFDNDPTPTFTFTANDDEGHTPLTFKCYIDSDSEADCSGGSFTPSADLPDGPHTFYVYSIDSLNNAENPPVSYEWTVDTQSPDVTIEQGSTQADPTNNPDITFDVTFNKTMTGFNPGDVNLGGTASSSVKVINTTDFQKFQVVVTAATNGTVTAFIPADAATDLAGNPNTDSTSSDNEVTFDSYVPVVVKIDSSAHTADNEITEFENTNLAITKLFVVFDVGMNESMVEDLANYGLLKDLVAYPIDSVVYDDNSGAGPFMAVLNVAALPDGKYTLTIKAAIENIPGSALGTDFVRHFSVSTSAPGITKIDSDQPTADHAITEKELTNAAIKKLIVYFDKAMNETQAEDVANYELLHDLAPYTINSATYDNGTTSVTLDVSSPDQLPTGSYKLTVKSGMEDVFGNALPVSFVRTFKIDLNAPYIAKKGVGSVPTTDDGVLEDGEVTDVKISILIVEFSEDVSNPPGDTEEDDVTNVNNYKLIRNGKDEIKINRAVYDRSTHTVYLTLNDGNPLPNGTYKLIVSGTTTIVDLGGTPLAGNGAPGTDFNLGFTIFREKLPNTGFAPNMTTLLPEQPADLAYSSLGDLWLEVPSLGIKSTIVGVPVSDKGWDTTWLWDQIGYLQGTAYPTRPGNTVVTGHVTTSDGKSGPFAFLKNLKYGDQVIVHFGGMKYIYEVRSTSLISPLNRTWLTRSEFYSWLTMITCQSFDEKTGEYRYRRVVRAVLVSAEADQ